MSTQPASERGTALMPPHEAIAALAERLTPVGVERVTLEQAIGRVLAEPVMTDRPSPSCDVSAMDGYALRLADLNAGRLEVAGEVVMGQAPPALPRGKAVRIFTGGAVPDGAEAVIRREDVEESVEVIVVPPGVAVAPGANIRRRGENADQGRRVIEAGEPVTPAVAGVLASFGVVEPMAHRRVRLSVIVTGNELLEPHDSPRPWQLRDSNGSVLRVMFGNLPWIELRSHERVSDEPDGLRGALDRTLRECDAVLLTGGVSMGDHDHVPGAVTAVGGEVVFHKLALRPGKPMLGAVGPGGQAILGLPGNPVSVMVTGRRLAAVAMRRLAGWREPDPPAPSVWIDNPGGKELPLWWHRLVRLTGPGRAALVRGMGSGDIVAAGRSDGFVEIPPRSASGPGPWPFYRWEI